MESHGAVMLMTGTVIVEDRVVKSNEAGGRSGDSSWYFFGFQEGWCRLRFRKGRGRCRAGGVLAVEEKPLLMAGC